MIVDIFGGPCDGAAIQVPKRTTSGLAMELEWNGVAHPYVLARRGGRIVAVPRARDATPIVALTAPAA